MDLILQPMIALLGAVIWSTVAVGGAMIGYCYTPQTITWRCVQLSGCLCLILGILSILGFFFAPNFLLPSGHGFLLLAGVMCIIFYTYLGHLCLKFREALGHPLQTAPSEQQKTN